MSLVDPDGKLRRSHYVDAVTASLGVCRSLPDFMHIHAILVFFCKSTGELVLTRYFPR
jgi:hypothetical protein